MASQQDVQHYLAYWFQLGKSVHIKNGCLTQRPIPVLEGHQFSRSFQDCWQTIMAIGGRDCYLDGTQETVEQLLSPQWEITDCARCSIPVAMQTVMPVAQLCACGDIDHWPNEELPAPHMPINNHQHFSRLTTRLNKYRSDELQVDYDVDHDADNQKSPIVNDRHHNSRASQDRNRSSD